MPDTMPEKSHSDKPSTSPSPGASTTSGTRPWIKRFLPKGFFGRSLLIILLPLILLQITATWAFYDRHYDTVTKRLVQAIAGEIGTVVGLISSAEDEDARNRILARMQTGLWIGLTFTPDGVLPGEPTVEGHGIVGTRLVQSLTGRLALPFVVEEPPETRATDIYVLLSGGVLHARVSNERLFTSTTYIFISWMVGSSVILFLVALMFMRNQVRPIRRLAIAAERFGRGLEVTHFKPEGASEIRQAAAAFLLMKERITRAMQQRTEMLAGVSHDLRTPLTRMKLQLAIMGAGPEIQELTDDVEEMGLMVEGYLAFARGEGTEQPQEAHLGRLMQEIAAQTQRDSTLNAVIEADPVLPLRKEAMRRAVTNLIVNAKRFAANTRLSLRVDKTEAIILIDDDGPGIPAAAREDAFKPFFRMDSSRNPETGGVGLGLTIARDVARSHGGDLVLEDSPMGGLRARLWLPL